MQNSLAVHPHKLYYLSFIQFSILAETVALTSWQKKNSPLG